MIDKDIKKAQKQEIIIDSLINICIKYLNLILVLNLIKTTTHGNFLYR